MGVRLGIEGCFQYGDTCTVFYRSTKSLSNQLMVLNSRITHFARTNAELDGPEWTVAMTMRPGGSTSTRRPEGSSAIAHHGGGALQPSWVAGGAARTRPRAVRPSLPRRDWFPVVVFCERCLVFLSTEELKDDKSSGFCSIFQKQLL